MNKKLRKEEDKLLLDAIEKKMGFRPVKSSMTLDEIGKFFNITRERVRQIEVRAFKKIRHPKFGRMLRAYSDM